MIIHLGPTKGFEPYLIGCRFPRHGESRDDWEAACHLAGELIHALHSSATSCVSSSSTTHSLRCREWLTYLARHNVDPSQFRQSLLTCDMAGFRLLHSCLTAAHTWADCAVLHVGPGVIKWCIVFAPLPPGDAEGLTKEFPNCRPAFLTAGGVPV